MAFVYRNSSVGIPLGYRPITETEINQLNYNNRRPPNNQPNGLNILEQSIPNIDGNPDRDWFLFEKSVGVFGKINKNDKTISDYNSENDSILSILMPLEYLNSKNGIPLGKRVITKSELNELNQRMLDENGKPCGLRELLSLIPNPLLDNNNENADRDWFLIEENNNYLKKININNLNIIDYNPINDSIIAILKPLEYLNSNQVIPLGKRLLSEDEIDNLDLINLEANIIPSALYNFEGFTGSRRWFLFRTNNGYGKKDRETGQILGAIGILKSSLLILKPDDYYTHINAPQPQQTTNPNPQNPDNGEKFIMPPKNIILYGPPGTGKTYNSIDKAVEIADKPNYKPGNHKSNKDIFNQLRIYETGSSEKIGQIEFVTFHQNYSYEDFVVGITPDVNSGTLQFKKREGIFKKLAERARENWELHKKDSNNELKNYVLIIDEINRANISKVFGELITLLEDDKRLGADNELIITLPNGEEFGVPPNLYIIGTMNTADKSISLIDIALRRRFEFIGYYPNYSNLKRDEGELLKRINDNIFREKRSADFLIGHAYFMKGQPIKEVLKNKVIPLLMEYFSGKTEIVSRIFDGTNKSVTYNPNTYDWDIN